MRFELWQIPVLVMAGILVAESLGRLVVRRPRFSISAGYLRLAVNLAILAGMLVFFVVGMFDTDSSLGDRVVTTITGLMNVLMTYWTYQSAQQLKQNARAAQPDAPVEAELQPHNSDPAA